MIRIMTERVEASSDPNITIAIVGGTGDQGQGLGNRLVANGHRVIIGSRDPSKAAAVAAMMGHAVSGASNHDAVLAADLVIVAVPWQAHESTLRDLQRSLAGRIVVDCVNPLGFDERGPFALSVPSGSATEQAAELLPDSTVVGAFHHVSAVVLLDEAVESVDTDVMVVGDDRPAVDLVIGLANQIPGMRGVYAGRLRNAHQVEALTANLIAANRRYKTHSGVRITGV
jgi:hypothetical protein